MGERPEKIRRVLETDRVWSAFVLGDLVPPYDGYCSWHILGESLVLIYRGFSPPLLFALGSPDVVMNLAEVLTEAEFYVSLRDGVLERFAAYGWRVEKRSRLFRMVFQGGSIPEDRRATRMGPVDYAHIEELYRDGDETGERPPFFQPASLEGGVYFGVWEGGSLVAAAGTLICAPSESVAGVGNVYVRRDRRRQGLAAVVTGAVTAHLVQLGIATIALNVRTDNPAAIRVYERLGFVRYCDYEEALIVRV